MTQHRPVRMMGGSRGKVPTFACDWDAEEHSFGVSSLEERRPVHEVIFRQRFLPDIFFHHMTQPVDRPFVLLDSEESVWVNLTRFGPKSVFDYLRDRQEALLNSADLEEALQDLKEVTADAEEDGLVVPSETAFDNAERLLKAMYRISPRRYGVYPAPDGYIAIDARGTSGRIAVVMCGSDGGVLCLVTIDNEQRRARYSTARKLPDGFIREALQELGEEPA